MVRSSPRARAGLSRLAASPWPAAPPAPIIVWASSMNRMIGMGEALTSAMTCLSRFSNSPLTPAPAWSRPRSRVRRATFLRAGGTSPSAIRRARPSTTAVLPTPASPVRIGLFWRRRIRMSTIWRTSASRPMTGSISPFLARSVRLMVNWSRAGVWVTAGRPLARAGGRSPPRSPAGPVVLGRAGDQLHQVGLEQVGLDLGQLARGVARQPAQLLVVEQRQQQDPRADLSGLVLDRGRDPGRPDRAGRS